MTSVNPDRALRPDPNPLSRGKRVLFGSIVVLGLWLFVEALAFVLFPIVEGKTFSYGRIREQQRRISGEELEIAVDRAPDAWEPLEPQVVHPYLGYVFDPSIPWPAANPRDAKSDWGFADIAPPFHERARDRLIVGIVGGSLAREFARDGTERLAQELRRSPVFAGREIVFVRLAVNGYKQPQQFITLSYLLSLGAELDVLINVDGFNEVSLHESENATRGSFVAYPRGWYHRVQGLPDREVQSAIGEIRYLENHRKRWAAMFAGPPLRYSIASNLLWWVRDSALLAGIWQAREFLHAWEPRQRNYLASGPTRTYASRSEMYEELAAIWRRSSLQLDRLCRANGIAYFHFLQPTLYLRGSKPVSELEQKIASHYAHPYRAASETGYPLLVRDGRKLAERGVRFRDLTRVFAEVRAPIYRDGCCHVNRRGNEILADEIAAWILASWG